MCYAIIRYALLHAMTCFGTTWFCTTCYNAPRLVIFTELRHALLCYALMSYVIICFDLIYHDELYYAFLCSSHLWLYFIKNKCEVYDCVVNFVNTVIVSRRVNHGLKEFVIQSDNGEAKSNRVIEFLRANGGALLTCCSYSPETQSKIERVWRTIHDMSTALMINRKLPEQFWALAMRYACLIYNNIPPSRTPKGIHCLFTWKKWTVCIYPCNIPWKPLLWW